MSIADRTTVMERGSILQTGTQKEIYFKPKSRFVAEFVGQANFFERKGSRALVLGQDVFLPASFEDGFAMLRPENIHFTESGVAGRVQLKEELGLITRYQIAFENQSLTVDTLSNQIENNYRIGDVVNISMDSNAIILVQNL